VQQEAARSSSGEVSLEGGCGRREIDCAMEEGACLERGLDRREACCANGEEGPGVGELGWRTPPWPPNSHKLANEHRGNDNQEVGPHTCEVVEWDGRRPADPAKGPREKESSEATG
jgi:hypothetical protein